MRGLRLLDYRSARSDAATSAATKGQVVAQMAALTAIRVRSSSLDHAKTISAALRRGSALIMRVSLGLARTEVQGHCVGGLCRGSSIAAT